jgi:hypothetical protein
VPQRGAANQVRLVAIPCCRSVRPRGKKSAVLVLYFEPGRLSEILLLETWLTANHETLRVELVQRLDVTLAIKLWICGPDMRDG